MEKKSGFEPSTIVVILVCAAIWWGWQTYLEKKYPEAMKATATTDGGARPLPQPVKEGQPQPGTAAPSTSATTAAANTGSDNSQIPRGAEKTWAFEDSHWKVTVSSYGGRVSNVELKKYTDSNGNPIKLVVDNLPGYLLTDVEGGTQPQLSKLDYKLNPVSQNELELTAENKGVKITKKLSFVADKYLVNYQANITGNTAGITRADVDVELPHPEQQESSGFLGRGRGADMQEYFFSYGTKKSREYVSPKEPLAKNYEQTNFAALGTRYFTTLFFNRSNVLPLGQAYSQDKNSYLRLSYPVLEPGKDINVNLQMYAGPKVLSQLRQVDETATQVVDFGTFSVIAVPLLKLMRFLFGLFKNYGVAIIALTILVRLVTFPFTYMSYKSMKAMQKIQPQVARIREIYKEDPQRMNAEMMKLWKDNKVNPMGGCLPMVLQLPVFWALYQVLQNSIELYHSPFFGWIKDLSVKDPYYVLPILMGATMFIQQKITPNTMDPAQARVMLIMPVFFSLLMMSLPSGLTLYIFISTLFGIIQQMYMMRDRTTVTAQPVKA